MAYATTSQLATYLGVPVSSLPSNASTLLDRASDVIEYYTLGRIDVTDTEQATVAQKATCQQVEYVITFGETDSTDSKYKSIGIGSFTATFDETGGQMMTLSPRARRTLYIAGMLYRGVRMR